MGLKQDIVIVNEYTRKTKNGGTRGSTPGDYVLRYMARDGAVETMAPVLRSNLDDYVTKYMLRENAVEAWPDDPLSAKGEMAAAMGYSGKAFGKEGDDFEPKLSFSHKSVKDVAKKIQSLYEDGHTVLKTVISFSDDYAFRMGVIRDAFEHRKRGDWEGNIDEARLRSAITAGMDALSDFYDDLVWIGCIQVDASKIHCHLCAVDAGEGTIMDDGFQRGTISEKAMMSFRRSANDDLLMTQPMVQFSDELQRDRQDVKAFVKKLTHNAMAQNGAPQFILACLPSDRTLWHAGSELPEMKRADQVASIYVRDILQEERVSLQEVYKRAHDLAEAEDLSPDEERKLVAEGEERLVSNCIEGVYSVLREIPEKELSVQTPVLDVMSCDFEELATSRGEDEFLEFGLKLRSYNSRYSYHSEKRREATSLRHAWEEADAAGEADEDSRPLYEFYVFEEEYQEDLVSKYAHFLSFLPKRAKQKAALARLNQLQRQVFMYQELWLDAEFQEIEDEGDAVTYAQEVHGVEHGEFYFRDHDLIKRQLDEATKDLSDATEALAQELREVGLTLVETRDGLHDIASGNLKPFDEVKALDLHHLDYDFTHPVQISKVNVDRFLAATEQRAKLLEAAVQYLEDTDQPEFIDDLPVRDVELMKRKAESLRTTQVIEPVRQAEVSGIDKASPTLPLDVPMEKKILSAIRESVQETLDSVGMSFGD